MSIPRHFPTPSPLQFGSRYKSKADMLVAEREFNQHMGKASLGTSVVGLSLLPLGGGAMFPILTGGACFSTIMDADSLYKAKIDQAKAEEPLPDTPEQSIEKALKALDADRQKQREMKEQILKAYAAEEAKLTALKQEAALALPQDSDKTISLAEELAVHRKGLEIQNQEKTVAQMKIHTEAAAAIDNQFEARMLEIKKGYLGMMDQLQQIEQNKKMLEMQKNLEQLKGSSDLFQGQSPELKGIQEKLDEELNKSNGQVDNFLVEANALSQLQAQEQRDLIESLKQQK